MKEFLNISKTLANEKDIAYANSRGFKVNVFTINDLQTTKELISAGVSGVFADNAPELSANYAASKKKFKINTNMILPQDYAQTLYAGWKSCGAGKIPLYTEKC